MVCADSSMPYHERRFGWVITSHRKPCVFHHHCLYSLHDDVIKWKHCPRYWPGPLWGEFTGHRWIPLTKASDAELWCFLWSAPWISDYSNQCWTISLAYGNTHVSRHQRWREAAQHNKYNHFHTRKWMRKLILLYGNCCILTKISLKLHHLFTLLNVFFVGPIIRRPCTCLKRNKIESVYRWIYNQYHYNDVIMSEIASQITNLTIVYSTVCSRRRSKKTSKIRVTGLCGGNSPVTGEFSTQSASNE